MGIDHFCGRLFGTIRAPTNGPQQKRRCPTARWRSSMAPLRGQRSLTLAASGYNDRLRRFPAARADRLDLFHHVHPRGDLAEDDVLAVKVGRLARAHEELGAVGIGTRVGHGKAARARVPARLSGEGLVRELLAIDGLTTRAVLPGEVAPLAHEARDDAVERRTRISEALLARAERAEVLRRLGDRVGVKLEYDPARGGATDRHLEVTRRVRHAGRGHSDKRSSGQLAN